MYTDFQKHIVKALTTLFYQDTEGIDYWDVDGNSRWIDITDKEDGTLYELSHKVIDNHDYIVVRAIDYDEFGEAVSVKDICYLLVYRERACWDLINYAVMIECIITNQISL